MKKRIFSVFLAVVMVFALLPTAAFAAETDLPDWYFLFAIFKNVDADGADENGVQQHAKYIMTRDEIDYFKEYARDFEKYMNQVGLMRAHVDVVEIDETVRELDDSDYGSWITAELAYPILNNKVDLDKYDHVFCVASLNIHTSYAGLTGGAFENGTGHSCLNCVDRETCLDIWRPAYAALPAAVAIHEFLHFMEQMSEDWDRVYNLHDIINNFYERVDGEYEACYTDVLLDRAKGTSGTGVHPAVWQYPPHVLRTMRELTVPSGVTGIGGWAFKGLTSLTKVTIPSSVVSIEKCAFQDCSGLAEVTISSGLTSIETWAFGHCTALTKISLPASVTSIGYAAFWDTGLTDVYYGGTEEQWSAIQFDEYNEALTNATIHYNSPAEETRVPTVTVDNIPANGTAYASTQNITIDGKAVKFEAYALKNENGDLTNYVKLRDVAVALNGTAAQFEVLYDGRTISLVTKTVYSGSSEMGTPFSGDRDYAGSRASVKVDGLFVDMTAITLYDSNYNGYTYFKLRDLGAVLGFDVGYSNETGISINTAQ